MEVVKETLPFVGMISVQFIQAGLVIAVKEAASNGMTKYAFVTYSNLLASFILLPLSFLLQRSNLPRMNWSLLWSFFLLGAVGCLMQVMGNAGVQITPASFSTSMLTLIPAFTFILAVIFRMEQADLKSRSTLAKSMGTVVLIIGALILTLYKGPSLLMVVPPSKSYDYVMGGFLFTVVCLAASAFNIMQAFLLKRCKAELIIVFFYCFFSAILSVIVSFLVGDNLAGWSLQSSEKLIYVLYSGIIGAAVQMSVVLWCLHQKGPLFICVFNPLGIIITTFVDIIFLGDTLHMGSLVGSIVTVIGFYCVMWGKANERKKDGINGGKSLETNNSDQRAPLLKNDGKEESINAPV
ncbi:WAT1-related protein At4g15540-like [Impatiens glandulifera]|uniref:WAT1-related protein At4g15540-like n=1 Tax=Impatiens glandulifera TaxID=253017 RepID=UPI001FB17E27|nr:WAT1-related protein At4g15540-like [Impatiens glandulifera]